MSHLRNEFHFSEVYRSVNQRGSCKLCWRPSAIYSSINIRKIKFIAYIYIHFNQNFDEKSDISANIEAGKHLHAVFSANGGTASMTS